MTISEILADLRNKGIELRVKGDSLVVDAPKGALTQELRTVIQEEKTGILEFLKRADGLSIPPASSIEPCQRGENIPLSYAQLHLWSLDQLASVYPTANIDIVQRLQGQLLIPALERGIQRLIQRHEPLRTSFRVSDGETFQVVNPYTPYQLDVVDLQDQPEEERDNKARELIQKRIIQHFDLENGPLFNICLITLAPGDSILMMVFHHIIADGWSVNVFMRELSALYAAAISNTNLQLPPLPIQYVDYAYWSRQRLEGEYYKELEAYWKHQLDGEISDLRLPVDVHLSSLPDHRGSSLAFAIPVDLLQTIKKFDFGEPVTEFMVLLAAFATLLYSYCGQEDILICSPAAGRTRIELEPLIGYFNNIILLRLDLSGNPGFRDLVRRVRKVVLEAHQYQDFPFLKVAEFPNLQRMALAHVIFDVQEPLSTSLNLPGITSSVYQPDSHTVNFDLAMTLYVGGQGGVMDYKTSQFSPGRIGRIAGDLVELLGMIARQPDRKISFFLTAKSGLAGSPVAGGGTGKETVSVVLPRDETEMTLAQIWEELFQMRPVSVTQSFFDLGGTSLMAVRLMAAIEKTFGAHLPVSFLFKANTIASMAEALRAGRMQGADIPTGAGGRGSGQHHLFFLGGGLDLVNLDKHMEANLPIYLIEWDTHLDTSKKLVEMAAHCRGIIQDAQPHGPYYLGGYCFGGYVMFEIAHQLIEEGEQVAYLALFDAPVAFVDEITEKHRLDQVRVSLKNKLKYHMADFFNKGVSINYVINVIIRKRIKNLLYILWFDLTWPMIWRASYNFCQKYSIPMPRFFLNTNYAFIYALECYKLKPYPGKLTIFHADKNVEDTAPVSGSRVYDWNRFANQGGEYHKIPGGHSDMFREPNVSILAKKLANSLQWAQATALEKNHKQGERSGEA